MVQRHDRVAGGCYRAWAASAGSRHTAVLLRVGGWPARVEEFLHENGYRNAPTTTWFSDFAFIVPFQRALINGDIEAQQRLQDRPIGE